MCRLLGIVRDRSQEFSRCLRDAPRSLRALSFAHPDGWGIGVWTMALGWRIQKRTCAAATDAEFERVVRLARGQTLIAHVRKRTVGEVSLDNTHPFRLGSWTFAHNGTVKNLAALRARTSVHRKEGIRGQTDSESLFAFMLSRLDEASAARSTIDRAVVDACGALLDDSATFLLSDGVVMYAFRRSSPLFFLEREDVSGAGRAVLFASEHVTDEPWQAIDDGVLLRVTRSPGLGIRQLA